MFDLDNLLDSVNHSVSTEAIRFQADPKFLRELEAEIKFLASQRGLSTRMVENSRIPAIIKEHTGLTFEVSGIDEFNAYAYLPELDAFHTHFTNLGASDYVDTREIDKVLKKMKHVEFGIDYRTGRLSGWVTELTHVAALGLPLIRGDEGFKAEEAAAIMGHEIGHVIDTYMVMHEYLSSNFLLDVFARELVGLKREEERIILINDVRNAGIALEENEALLKEADVTKVRLHLINDATRMAVHRLGYNPYDLRAAEQAADNYVTRMGYGMQLARGLDRLHRLYGLEDNRVGATIFGIIIVWGSLICAPLGLLNLAVLLCFNMQEEMYDDPKRRIQAIRKQHVARLKNTRKSETRKAIAHEIEELDQILKDYQVWRPFFSTVQSVLGFIDGRAQYRHITAQKLTEDIASSDLHLAATYFED